MRTYRFLLLAILSGTSAIYFAQEANFDGLAGSLSNIYRTSKAKSFSISPENFTGEKGKGGMATQGVSSHAAEGLGRGWKVNPYVVIEPKKTFTLAEITGEGAIQHIWMTPTGNWRSSILRMYWDGRSRTLGSGACGPFLRHGVGKIRAALLAGYLCESG